MVALFAQQSNILEFPQPSSGRSEWYTASRYIEAARAVMGTIDLDPASCEFANRTVKATRYCTKEDNGLMLPWFGNVWLNPPYSRSMQMQARHQSSIGMFIEKLLSHYTAGDVTQAVLLTTCRTDTAYFRLLWEYPICFSDHLVHFKRPKHMQTVKNPDGTHMQGTCFIYLGPHEQKFIDIFSQFGTVARRVSVPKVQPVTLSLWEVQP